MYYRPSENRETDSRTARVRLAMDPYDLRIDRFKPGTAVCITHIPTNTVVVCSEEDLEKLLELMTEAQNELEPALSKAEWAFRETVEIVFDTYSRNRLHRLLCKTSPIGMLA